MPIVRPASIRDVIDGSLAVRIDRIFFLNCESSMVFYDRDILPLLLMKIGYKFVG